MSFPCHSVVIPRKNACILCRRMEASRRCEICFLFMLLRTISLHFLPMLEAGGAVGFGIFMHSLAARHGLWHDMLQSNVQQTFAVLILICEESESGTRQSALGSGAGSRLSVRFGCTAARLLARAALSNPVFRPADRWHHLPGFEGTFLTLLHCRSVLDWATVHVNDGLHQ